ncbi:MAG TPA: nitroreductase family deazaflavin-dependent oxidoreductase [Pseudonocardia sp.]|jgi:deazaflavin-dependent oxidoreductase (nitroreductase family)|nr:nitroreductase family deazaflavin-dependent oxidoreductase [Pseudonocardia sp.]
MTQSSDDAVGTVIRQVKGSDHDWERVYSDVEVMTRKQLEDTIEQGTTDGVEVEGKPVVIVFALGAKSGQLKRFPLMRVEHEGSYALVASLGGAPKNPAWYHNIKANPHVELQDGSVTHKYVAEEVHGARRDEWWVRAVKAYPSFEVYQSHCERLIPVFELTRTD